MGTSPSHKSKYHPVYTWWKWAVMPSFLSFFAILLLYKFPFTRNVFIWYLTFQQTYTDQIYFNKHSLYSQIIFIFLSLDIQRNKAGTMCVIPECLRCMTIHSVSLSYTWLWSLSQFSGSLWAVEHHCHIYIYI